MNNRIDRRYAELGGNSALILYVTAGHPDPAVSRRVAPTVAAMADIIEIGIPFSDPVADGPIIQQSTQEALRNGTHVADCFQLASEVRKTSDTPVVFLTYYNPVLHLGLERFATESFAAGVDGVICADLPAEEAGPLHRALKGVGLHLIPMVAPTSTGDRLSQAGRIAGGFVYCVSRTGVTGLRDALSGDLPDFLARVRSHTDLPRAVGFGVSTPEHARAVSRLAEGVIIGSALVDLIEKSPSDETEARVRTFVAGIREGMRGDA